MKVIKGVLEEELQNSLRMKKQYETAIKKLPRGSLVEKKIRGHKYFYLAIREKNKVKFVYKGKMPEEEQKRYMEAKIMRAKYGKLLSQINKQIAFLKKALNEKSIRSLS